MKEKIQQSSFTIFLVILVIVTTCSALICPNSTSISPCVCKNNVNFNNSISVECSSKRLNDSEISRILDIFLLTPGLSPVVDIWAVGHFFTKVPSQISKFPFLSTVSLGSNKITEIPDLNGTAFLKNYLTNGTIEIRLSLNLIKRILPGVFKFPFASKVVIDLGQNQIDSVSAFDFPSASSATIYLWNNNISDFPNSPVFNIPSALGNVQIFLTDNRIKVVPSATVFNFRWAKSVYIDLTRNNITSIPCTSQLSFPLATMVLADLASNKITAVPSCAFNFPTATTVRINLNSNLITTIAPGSFNFPSGQDITMILSDNQISAIPPNTFSQGNYYMIFLSNNPLKRFESAVFKTPLKSLITNTLGQLYIGKNQFDCSTDPCHLAWLFKNTDSSQLRSRIFVARPYQGVCSNNTSSPFSALNNFNFTNCPCSY